jgi:hypothetical protein
MMRRHGFLRRHRFPLDTDFRTETLTGAGEARDRFAAIVEPESPPR